MNLKKLLITLAKIAAFGGDYWIPLLFGGKYARRTGRLC